MKYSMLLALILSALSALACQMTPPPPAPVYERPAQSETEPTPDPAPYAPQPLIAVPPPSGPLPAIRVWISPDVESQYVDSVRAGVEAWAYVFKGVRDFVFVDATPEEVVDTDVADVAIWEIGPYGGTCNDPGTISNALGCVRGIGGLWNNVSGSAMDLYLVDTTFTADGHAAIGFQRNPKLVTMHEMGHLFGLTHQDGGLMWGPSPEAVLGSEWDCPDAQSVARLVSKFELDPHSVRSCELPEAVAELDAEIIHGSADHQ